MEPVMSLFPSYTNWWAFSRADTLLAKLAIFIETAKYFVGIY